MGMSGKEALDQAKWTAGDYAGYAIERLCEELGIDRSDPDWRNQLAPFASVLAAMVTAAAADLDTAMRGGAISPLKNELAITHGDFGPLEADVTVRRGYSEAERNSWYSQPEAKEGAAE